MACGSSAPRETVPAAMVGGEAAGPVLDEGELVLRSAGKDFGHERFTVRRDGGWQKIEVVAETTFPDPMAIDMAMWVDPSSWQLDRYELRLDRGGESCLAVQRHQDGMVTLDVEFPDGSRRLVDREGREHAQYFISIRPAVTQMAVCGATGAEPRMFESFSPWYIVRASGRTRSTVPRVGGGFLDVVRLDELIDVYCDGPKLAIVHYAAHGFLAARTEYDEAAQALGAADPTGELWAGELRCPARAPD